MADRQRQEEDHRDRPVVGADLQDRPGVPMEMPPHKLTPAAPESFERQKPRRGILHRRELAGLEGVARAEAVARLAAEHAEQTGGLATAVSCGAVDEIVEPARTRTVLATALAGAPDLRGDRGNIPL